MQGDPMDGHSVVDKHAASAPQMAQMAHVVQAQQFTPLMENPAHHQHQHQHQQLHHHDDPSAPAGTKPCELWANLFLFVSGLVCVLVGTCLIRVPGAAIPLVLSGEGCILVAASVMQIVYRMTLVHHSGWTACEGPAGRLGCLARLVAIPLYAFGFMIPIFMLITDDDSAAFGAGMFMVAGFLVAYSLLQWEAEQCRQAVLKTWEDWCKFHKPIQISEVSVEQLAAAAQARGEPYFTASVVQFLREKQVDGVVLNAILTAEEQQGADFTSARAFVDEMFEGVSVQHKIVAKGVLREWVARGVPPQPQPQLMEETALVGTVVTAV